MDNSLRLEKAKDRGIVDSGCSRSMSGNKDKLEDFEDFDGGEVTFGGSTGKISRKCTIKTKTLKFKNVLYVKELQHFNLISVSQICDQTHRVLFTENECLVLSKDFPLPDPSMVILSILRKHKFYTFSLNEHAPKGPFTCLIAKASQNESTLWHRRLGHVNFNNMNKVVKGNLVRAWFLFTFAGRVTFCWLFPIPAGDLVSAGHMLFLLAYDCYCWLTANPTIYASVVRQFWGSASEVSLPDGVRGLVAPIDGTAYTVTEASIKREPAFKHAQQPDVSQPPPSPVVAPHPSHGPMPSHPRQSSPPPIPFGPAPTSGVVSTEPIPDIPFSSGPSEPVLETITSPFGDDDTGGGSFHESPPRPHPATPTISPTVGVAEDPLTLTSFLAFFPTCLQRIATLEAEHKDTKILHRDTVVLFAKRIKKLESKLKTKKRKLVLNDSESEKEARKSKELDALLDLANAALHEPSLSTTLSKPANPKQSSEQEISLTTLDVVLTLSQSKARARAATIIYKRLKKKKSSSSLDFTDADIPAGRLDSGGGLDSVGGLDSAGGVDSAGGLTSVVATPSSPVTAPTDKELADQQAAILEADRQELLEQELNQSIDTEQVYLDSLLAQRVAEEQDRESMASEAQQRKAIGEMKAKAKREKPMTPAQQKEFIRTFVKNQSSVIYSIGWTWKDVRGLTDDQLQIVYDKIQRAVELATAKDQHQYLKRSGETLESLESEKLKSSHSTTQPAELQETTFVSACVPIAAGDPISAGFSVSAAFSIPAATLIVAGVSTTAGASGSDSEAYVPIIELLDSPPKDTSLPLDPETEEQDEPLRKSSRKKSIAKKENSA
nr:ribonuclease H-like domain-containing protein [Tanacetum cinerariifolium]